MANAPDMKIITISHAVSASEASVKEHPFVLQGGQLSAFFNTRQTFSQRFRKNWKLLPALGQEPLSSSSHVSYKKGETCLRYAYTRLLSHMCPLHTHGYLFSRTRETFCVSPKETFMGPSCSSHLSRNLFCRPSVCCMQVSLYPTRDIVLW